MQQTWRWFGESDPISLAHIRQAGATGVVTALHQFPPGQVWPDDEIRARRDTIESEGLAWSVCESIPVPDSIKCGGPEASRHRDAWKDTLRNLGRAGIPVVCYNFMPVVDWTRTDLDFALSNGARALRFDWTDFVAYDVCVLKRRGAEADYQADLVERAERRFDAMSEGQIERLERNIIAGLPGSSQTMTRAGVADEIGRFAGISDTDMRSLLADFLNEVVPVAEEFGTRLAIHPDDPPYSLFGLPRIVSTQHDAEAILAANGSVANGLTFCTGSYGARADNDLEKMARDFASRIHFAHLRNVDIGADGSFHEADHLDGSADMVAILKILMDEETRIGPEGHARTIPMRPDHGHELAGDIGRDGNPGYSYIGRLKGLAELRGVMRAIEQLDR
jgi:mannonate dehydratase